MATKSSLDAPGWTLLAWRGNCVKPSLHIHWSYADCLRKPRYLITGKAVQGVFYEIKEMNSQERKKARFERRVAKRAAERQIKTSPYDNFENVANPENLYAAFRKSRREVSWKESIQRYEMNLFRNIAETRRKLLAGEKVAHGFVEFDIIERGRPRHIKSVHISERVPQKSFCDTVLVPLISRSLIYDNGASLKNKGLHFAINRLITHMGKFYRANGNSNEGYCLSIDFSKFFDTIRHDVLYKQQEKLIHDKRIMKLIRDFVSPFGDNKSLGLGSQVSQISAILYPNRIDHYIKEALRIKYYGRYMDDLYLIHKDREYLKYCLTEIQKICTDLGITINHKKSRIKKKKSGIKFLKGVYYLMETGRIVRRADPNSRKRMRRKLTKFKSLLEAGKMAYNDVYTGYQSWRGNYLKRFDAFHTVRRMDGLYNRLFIFDRRV
jgi:hypothetical protein